MKRHPLTPAEIELFMLKLNAFSKEMILKFPTSEMKTSIDE
jgi:hypothetical protein